MGNRAFFIQQRKKVLYTQPFLLHKLYTFSVCCMLLFLFHPSLSPVQGQVTSFGRRQVWAGHVADEGVVQAGSPPLLSKSWVSSAAWHGGPQMLAGHAPFQPGWETACACPPPVQPHNTCLIQAQNLLCLSFLNINSWLALVLCILFTQEGVCVLHSLVQIKIMTQMKLGSSWFLVASAQIY